MHNKQPLDGFAALFFSQGSETSAMYVSTPAPAWIGGNGRKSISVTESGMFCLYLLVFSKTGGGACLTVNGRDIEASLTGEKNGEICTSAVCSIREAALPCSLGASLFGETEEGVLLIVKCNV